MSMDDFKPIPFIVVTILVFWFYCETKTSPYETNSSKGLVLRKFKLDWPMEWSNNGSLFDLRLDYKIDITMSSKKFQLVKDNLVLKNGTGMSFLNYEQLKNIPNNLWKVPHHPLVYLLYPQAYNLTEIYSALLKRKPIAEAPINGDAFRYLALPKVACHPDNTFSQNVDYIVVVKSAVRHFDKRKEFRRLYSSYANPGVKPRDGLHIALIFSLGRVASLNNGTFLRAGRVVNVVDDYKIPDDLQSEHLMKKLKEERLLYNDLLVGDFEDTYYNLTTKTIYTFQWIAAFCRLSRPVVIFIDEDAPISMKKMIRALLKLPRIHKENLYNGFIYEKAKVLRFTDSGDNKNSVEIYEIPWFHYPPYINGALTVLGFSNIEILSIGSLFTQKMINEDAFTGIVALKMGIQPRRLSDILKRKFVLTRKRHHLKTISYHKMPDK